LCLQQLQLLVPSSRMIMGQLISWSICYLIIGLVGRNWGTPAIFMVDPKCVADGDLTIVLPDVAQKTTALKATGSRLVIVPLSMLSDDNYRVLRMPPNRLSWPKSRRH
jgi:hypothetical protein